MSLQRVCVRVCMCNSTAFCPRSYILFISGSHTSSVVSRDRNLAKFFGDSPVI